MVVSLKQMGLSSRPLFIAPLLPPPRRRLLLHHPGDVKKFPCKLGSPPWWSCRSIVAGSHLLISLVSSQVRSLAVPPWREDETPQLLLNKETQLQCCTAADHQAAPHKEPTWHDHFAPLDQDWRAPERPPQELAASSYHEKLMLSCLKFIHIVKKI